MIEIISRFLDVIQPIGFLVFAVFLRIGSSMMLLPAFGERIIPVRVRLVLGLSFSIIIFPSVASVIAGSSKNLPIIAWLAVEISIGVFIGLALRLFVLALQTAGTVAAQALSLSQLFGGTTGEPQPAVGELLTLGGLALAVHFGLHVKICEIFILSYDAFPPGSVADSNVLKDWGVSGVAKSFSLAFAISAPFIAFSLIYNIALGVINRAMPQLMVAFVGAPALTLGGMVLLYAALPSGIFYWQNIFDGFLSNPFEIHP